MKYLKFKKFLVFYNPASGKGKALKVWE